MTSRDVIEQIVDTWEGADFTNDPADRGGPTRFGVTQRRLGEFLGRAASVADVQALDRDTAVTIHLAYCAQYGATKMQAPAVTLALCDYLIHSGPAVAIRALQRILAVKVDGVCGPETIAAANAAPPMVLAARLCGERVKGWARLWAADKRQLKWAGGWCNRLAWVLAQMDAA